MDLLDDRVVQFLLLVVFVMLCYDFGKWGFGLLVRLKQRFTKKNNNE